MNTHRPLHLIWTLGVAALSAFMCSKVRLALWTPFRMLFISIR